MTVKILNSLEENCKKRYVTDGEKMIQPIEYEGNGLGDEVRLSSAIAAQRCSKSGEKLLRGVVLSTSTNIHRQILEQATEIKNECVVELTAPLSSDP